MNAPELSRQLVAAIESGKHDVIICNVANPDKVGHTGSLAAAVAAVEAVDRLLGEVLPELEHARGEALITAEHGNVEQMRDPASGQPHNSQSPNTRPQV